MAFSGPETVLAERFVDYRALEYHQRGSVIFVLIYFLVLLSF